MENNSLSHWGIKGMRWGVRRYQNKDGTLTPAGKKRQAKNEVHDDYAKAHDKKSVKQMSDKELQARNNRLQMEQNYKRLTEKTGRGEKAVKAFISTAGTITAVAGAYKVYKGLADSGIDKIGDWVVNSIDLTKPFA